MKPRVRFAPSPTGQLHLGGARTALSNFLFTKSQGGSFLVRIEDTDLERSKTEHTDQICDSLKWLGLHWDEEMAYQSENGSSYEKGLDSLLESGKAYRCFASKEELDDIREGSDSFHYPGIWRDRQEKEIQREIDEGTPFTIRLRTPQTGNTEFNDLIYGSITVSNTEIDDFIIARSDGSPVYNFTNVIDDQAMGITHVIRGEDHVSNTSKQILIYEALGHDTPEFAHLPMILGEDKKRLSKRHGATGVDEYRRSGYQPGALLNYLALLGWNPGTEEEIFDLDELVNKFDLGKVQKKSAVFDHKKFNWVSSQHLMAQDSSDLLENVIEMDPRWGEDHDRSLRMIDLMKPRSNSLVDLIDRSGYLFGKPEEFNEAELAKVWKEDTPGIMKDLGTRLEPISDWASSKLESRFKEFMEETGLGFGRVMRPLRLALCGSLQGPSLFEIMELLGKEESLNRINYAISEF
tara:strand:+ start:59 stop:1450 length:1392 start_codon:yes stop_codon:yes gene_type:complete